MSVNIERSDFSFKNTEEYIHPKRLASLFQRTLNSIYGTPAFGVYLENKTEINDDETFTGTLKTSLSAYSLRNLSVATYNIRLLILYPTENITDKDKLIGAVAQLCGPSMGEIADADSEGNETDYTFFMNLNYQETPTPENIRSEWTSTITLSGYMNLTRTGGGILADQIGTYIVINGSEYEIVLKNGESGCSFNVESPLKGGYFHPSTEYISGSQAMALSVHYQDNYIGNLLRDWSYNLLSDSLNPFFNSEDGTYTVTIKKVFPDKSITQTFYCLSVKYTEEKGTYTMTQLTLTSKP